MIKNTSVARSLEIGSTYETPSGEFVVAATHIARHKTQCTYVGNSRIAGTFCPSELKLAVNYESNR
jgi:hypothetical protein